MIQGYNVHHTKTRVYSERTLQEEKYMTKNVSIGLLGLGVVGSGVIHIIQHHQDKLSQQLGCEVSIKRILVSDLEKERPEEIDRSLLTTEPNEVLDDADIDIIVEVMGGLEDSYHYILQALRNKKHVVTANKDLIALHGVQLLETAKQNGCDLFYEASVAGGIPILRSLTDGLAADRIQRIMGIVNGTTNYILTKMEQESITFDEALQEAQELGFAEADPTADVEGLDAARKMVILARLAFSTKVELDSVDVKGISNISLKDLQYGNQLGYNMKLIGIAQNDHDKSLEVSVQPTFISQEHPLAGVKDEYNAIFINGEAVGETMFYGPGAGSLPTATAVMSDVVTVIKNMQSEANSRDIYTPTQSIPIAQPEESFSKYYIRLHAHDEVGAFASISQLFNNMDISFEQILQTPSEQHKIAEIVLITHRTSAETFNQALEKLKTINVVKNIQSYFHVEGDAKQ